MKEFHGFSAENIILNENDVKKRVKKTVLLNKIGWSTDSLVEIQIVKFGDFYLFNKERKMNNVESNLSFREKLTLNEKFLRFSNINKIILKQKLHR